MGIACEKELLTAVRTLSDTDNRAYALEALSKFGARAELATCIDLLTNEDEKIQKAAATALIKVGLDDELHRHNLLEVVENRHKRPPIIQHPKKERQSKGVMVEERFGDIVRWVDVNGRRVETTRNTALDALLYNYPADTSRLSESDIAVRDMLRLVKSVEDKKMSLEEAKDSVLQIHPDLQAVHEFNGVFFELFEESYSSAKITAELALHAAKHHTGLVERIGSALGLALVCRETNLLTQSLDAYRDVFESSKILSKYFKFDPKFQSGIEHNIQIARDFFESHPRYKGTFLLLISEEDPFVQLLNKIEKNFPENAFDQKSGCGIAKSSDACCRLVPWIQANESTIANADISNVERYIYNADQGQFYHRSLNVLALGEALVEAKSFTAAKSVLQIASSSFSDISHIPYAGHADILAAYSSLRCDEKNSAINHLKRINEQKLRSLAQVVITTQADLGQYLLVQAEINIKDSSISTKMIEESRHHISQTTVAMCKENNRQDYLRNLYLSMVVKRAEIIIAYLQSL